MNEHTRLAYELTGVIVEIESGLHFDTTCMNTIKRVREGLQALAKEGDVVVTKNTDGVIVAVTRQDEEGRVLKIISQSELKSKESNNG